MECLMLLLVIVATSVMTFSGSSAFATEDSSLQPVMIADPFTIPSQTALDSATATAIMGVMETQGNKQVASPPSTQGEKVSIGLFLLRQPSSEENVAGSRGENGTLRQKSTSFHVQSTGKNGFTKTLSNFTATSSLFNNSSIKEPGLIAIASEKSLFQEQGSAKRVTEQFPNSNETFEKKRSEPSLNAATPSLLPLNKQSDDEVTTQITHYSQQLSEIEANSSQKQSSSFHLEKANQNGNEMQKQNSTENQINNDQTTATFHHKNKLFPQYVSLKEGDRSERKSILVQKNYSNPSTYLAVADTMKINDELLDNDTMKINTNNNKQNTLTDGTKSQRDVYKVDGEANFELTKEVLTNTGPMVVKLVSPSSPQLPKEPLITDLSTSDAAAFKVVRKLESSKRQIDSNVTALEKEGAKTVGNQLTLRSNVEEKGKLDNLNALDETRTTIATIDENLKPLRQSNSESVIMTPNLAAISEGKSREESTMKQESSVTSEKEKVSIPADTTIAKFRNSVVKVKIDEGKRLNRSEQEDRSDVTEQNKEHGETEESFVVTPTQASLLDAKENRDQKDSNVEAEKKSTALNLKEESTEGSVTSNSATMKFTLAPKVRDDAEKVLAEHENQILSSASGEGVTIKPVTEVSEKELASFSSAESIGKVIAEQGEGSGEETSTMLANLSKTKNDYGSGEILPTTEDKTYQIGEEGTDWKPSVTEEKRTDVKKTTAAIEGVISGLSNSGSSSTNKGSNEDVTVVSKTLGSTVTEVPPRQGMITVPSISRNREVSVLPLRTVSTKTKWRPFHFNCSKEEDEKGELCLEWGRAGLCLYHRPTMFLFCRKTCLCVGPPDF